MKRFFLLAGTFLFGLAAGALTLLAQEPAGKLELRYGIELNLDRYPQKKPQEALQSVVKAIGEKRLHYLLAQLSHPGQVDARVQRLADTFTKGSPEERKLVAFEEVVRVSTAHFLNDPILLKELRQFAAAAEWAEEKEDQAIATRADLPDRKLIFHKLEGRWFLDNRQR